MTDLQFDDLIIRSVRAFGLEYIDDSELDETPHIFSWRFERCIARLLNKGFVQRPSRNIRISKRLRYYLLAAVLMAFSALLLGAGIRLYEIFEFDIYETHTNLSIFEDEAVLAETIETYEITEGLEGFELEYASSSAGSYIYTYETDELWLNFRQCEKSLFSAYIDTEGYETVHIEIKGNEGFYVERCNEQEGDYGTMLVWEQGAYAYWIHVLPKSPNPPSIGIDELVVMAESTQPTDKDLIQLPYRLTSDRLDVTSETNLISSCRAEYKMETDGDVDLEYLVQFDWCSEKDFQPAFTIQNMVTVSVNGQDALYKYVPKLKKEYLVWQVDDSVFTIQSEIVDEEPLGENALIELAESMQKVE